MLKQVQDDSGSICTNNSNCNCHSEDEVNTLVNNNIPSGTYSTKWDGKNKYGQQVSSGVYLYHLQAGEFSAVRKMVLIRQIDKTAGQAGMSLTSIILFEYA